MTKKITATVISILLFNLLAATAFADDQQRWAGIWGAEHRGYVKKVVLNQLRDASIEEKSRDLLEMIRLETQLSAVATARTKFYGSVLKSRDVNMAGSEILFKILQDEHIATGPSVYFENRSFKIKR
ncbi:hypothetical protein [Maridesulfovibrio sp.]|uniref:hypothetical protein n=1 Tax=Maridesulfovibrio sp. TaxID=2795000 RepID=UPI0039EF455E